MSLKEISRKFGVSLQTIAKSEKSALAKIRIGLEDEANRQGMTIEEWLAQFS